MYVEFAAGLQSEFQNQAYTEKLGLEKPKEKTIKERKEKKMEWFYNPRTIGTVLKTYDQGILCYFVGWKIETCYCKSWWSD